MKQLLGLILALVLTACNSNYSNDGETMVLSLNDGNKWKVNAEMTPFIDKGNEILSQYTLEQGTDFEGLADALKAENKKLIKSCTMKGASHDELHKWLHPHMTLIKNLGDAENPDEAASIIKRIESSFSKYKMYFE